MAGKTKVRPIETTQVFDFTVKKGKEDVPPGCLAVLEGYATLSDDKSNKNKHLYPKGFWASVLNDNEFIKEKLETKTFFGSFRHPEKDESPVPEFGNISHNVRSYKVDEKGVYVVLDILDTAQGRELKPLLDYGSQLGVSTRAYGEVELTDEGYKVPVKGKYMFVTWDMVSNPAFSATRMSKVSDSVEFEVSDSVFELKSKEDFMEKVKTMSKNDAEVLCRYMGYDFSEVADSFVEKNDAEKALDQALDLIKKLEDEVASLKENSSDSVVLDLRNQVSVLTDENNRLKESLSTNPSATEVQRLYNSIEFLKSKLKEVSDEKTRLVESNSMLKGIVSDKNRTIDTLETKISDLNDGLLELTNSNRTLQKINSGLEDKILQHTSAQSISDSHQPSATARKVKKSGPMFRVHSGEESQVLSDDTSGMKEVFTKLNR